LESAISLFFCMVKSRLSINSTNAAEALFCSGGHASINFCLATSSLDRWSFSSPAIEPSAAT
jgi:hypothetical protein